MSKTINLGRVTAYADAVAAGYTGTREEFAQDLANAATYAAESHQSAETASAAAETASTAATTATTAASSASDDASTAHADAEAALSFKQAAETAAGTATTKAGEAANSASQAATSASGAAGSATAASGSATAAAGSATNAAASETAAAGSATSAAGSASAAAQTLVDVNAAGATQIAAIGAKGEEVLESIPSDYTELSQDVDDLKSDVANKVNKPTSSPNGTSGQLLRTNGDGTTTWVDYGLPTDAQTATAVTAWLNDHPEATTTVEDGSLTEAKFTDVLELKTIKDYVTPEMFGAKGDGETDDVAAIENALAYINENTVSYTGNIFSCPTLVLDKSYYVSRDIVIPDMHKLAVRGENNGCLIGGGLKSTGSKLRYFTVDNVLFYNSATFISFDYENIEHGEYIVKNCKFSTCSDYALKIKRRSGFVYVEHCQFIQCAKAAYFHDCDNLTIEHNWIYSSVDGNTDNYVIVYVYNENEGGTKILNNFFIPAVAQSGSNCAWVRTGGSAIIQYNRFSGESNGGNLHPVIVAFDKLSAYEADPYNYSPPLFDFCDNTQVGGKTSSLLIDNFEGNMIVERNCGWSLINQPIIELLNSSTTQYDDLPLNNLQLRIKDNLGRAFKYYNSRNKALTDLVPTVLYKFLNSGPVYYVNSNWECEYKNSDGVFTITFPYLQGYTENVNSFRKENAFLLVGDVCKNTSGSASFVDPLIGILSYYISSESGILYLYPVFNRISGGDQTVTYVPAVCGETTKINITDANSRVAAGTFTLSLTAQFAFGTQAINVKKCIPIGDIKPFGNILSN